MRPENVKGGVAAASAFLLWGFLPIYWKQLAAAPALEVIAHRWVWTSVLLVGILAATGRLDLLRAEFRSGPIFASHALRALLLATNWLTYVWAVFHERILEASLGYFLVPLVNVALGLLFLKERLNLPQKIAVGFAVLGVGFFAVQTGGMPWVPLVIAFSFGFYGLLRKQASVGALSGAAMEMSALVPVAIVGLILLHAQGSGSFLSGPPRIDLLLAGTGFITAVPLVLFGYGSKRITLTSIGLFQYLAPTVKFVIGLWIYHEPFTAMQLAGFTLIWTALAVYSWNGLWFERRRPIQVVPE